MDDRCGVDFGDSQQDAIAKLLPGLHPDVPKKGARHLAEKGLHDIEPRSMLWRQHVLKAIGTSSQEGSSLFRNMRGMVIQDDSNDAPRRRTVDAESAGAACAARGSAGGASVLEPSG